MRELSRRRRRKTCRLSFICRRAKRDMPFITQRYRHHRLSPRESGKKFAKANLCGVMRVQTAKAG